MSLLYQTRNELHETSLIFRGTLEHCGGGGIGYRRKAEVKLAGGGGNSGEADSFAVDIKDGVEGLAIKK